MVGRATPTADIMNGARNWTAETINIVWPVEIRGWGLLLLLFMFPLPKWCIGYNSHKFLIIDVSVRSVNIRNRFGKSRTYKSPPSYKIFTRWSSFCSFAQLRRWKKILILKICCIFLRFKIVSALNLNKFPKNLMIELKEPKNPRLFWFPFINNEEISNYLKSLLYRMFTLWFVADIKAHY